jgi:hypothetical protein
MLAWRSGAPRNLSTLICCDESPAGSAEPQRMFSSKCSRVNRELHYPAMLTRRRFIHNSTAALTLASAPSLLSATGVRARYRNPILGGDHPDASPIRVGDDGASGRRDPAAAVA